MLAAIGPHTYTQFYNGILAAVLIVLVGSLNGSPIPHTIPPFGLVLIFCGSHIPRRSFASPRNLSLSSGTKGVEQRAAGISILGRFSISGSLAMFAAAEPRPA